MQSVSFDGVVVYVVFDVIVVVVISEVIFLLTTKAEKNVTYEVVVVQ